MEKERSEIIWRKRHVYIFFGGRTQLDINVHFLLVIGLKFAFMGVTLTMKLHNPRRIS